MFKQWVKKSVDLGSLSDAVVRFLERKGFMGKRTVVEKGFIVSGKGSLGAGVIVRILGEPDDFIVELESGSTRTSEMLGSSTVLFGGGGFLLRSLKSKEALEKLESEFWIYMEDVVARLQSSKRT